MLSTSLVLNMSVRLSSSLLALVAFFPQLSVAQNTITVAAAADLASLEPALVGSFRKIHPDLQIQFVTEASGALAQQIENGAPYDVFMSANAQFVEKLALNRKLHPDSVRAYAEGRLGILWRDGKNHSLKDLQGSGIRYIALANPQLAPYGLAAQQALQHAGVWQFVRQKVVFGENVRQALQLYESGNADVVLTAGSLLKGRSAQLIPAEWHQPILQKAGAVAASKNVQNADFFLNFLTSPAGQAVFAKYGFSSPRLTEEQRH
jgi:molybdate transport system substrate-binding protein